VGLVELSRDAWEGEQAFGHGGDGKESSVAVIEQRAFAGVVAGSEDLLAGGSVDGEGIASEQVIHTGGTPAEPGGHKKCRVGQGFGVDETKFTRQGGTVIQPYIGYQTAGMVWAPERLNVKLIFG
jgi:hypothetical protein